MRNSGSGGTWGWVLLGGMLAALLAAAAAVDRLRWPALVGDEATYLMQAESLAFDRDLTYERRDYDRFVAHWGRPPDGLILQSGDGGATITFGKPFFYALWLAPFTRAAPTRGPFVANALLLAAAAVAAARMLRRPLGSAAPVWVTVFVFASVAFAHVFWAHADLFLLCLTALALALAFGAQPGWRRPRPAALARWGVVGGLLAVVVFSRPLYLPLLLPAALAVPAPRRMRSWAALSAGAALVVLLGAATHLSLTGSLTGYGAQRRGFYGHTGFPGVDFPAAAWEENLGAFGAHSSTGGPLGQWREGVSLLPWNALYSLAGRHVGVLPYFLPLLLAFAGRPRGAARWSLVAAVAAAMLAFLLLRPFNFFGGAAALGNRYFLPLYAALWFLPTRAPRRPLAWAAVVVLAAAPFLVWLWRHPATFPLTAEGALAWPTTAAGWLPYETTQSKLKPAGREDVVHGAVWVKLLDRDLWTEQEGAVLVLGGTGRGELLVGSPVPLAALEVAVLSGTLGDPAAATAGEPATVPLGRATARHLTWWSAEPWSLYRLRVRRADEDRGAVRFQLRPAAARPEPPG